MEPKCDYVLVFDTSVAKSTENPPMPNEYLQLVDALKNAGLHVTARQGAPGSETILVLLRATTARLLKELELQARLDFTKGVHTPRANMLLESAAQREVPLTPAERLALVNQIISTSQERSTADVKYAGVSPGGGLPSLAATWKQLTSKYATESPFGRVKGIFPPHDEEWNKKWLSSWSKELFILKENPEQLDQVAAHFGANIAMYFAFLRYYFAALIPATAVGVLTWAASTGSFSPLYSIAIVLWSILFVEWWKIKERKLAVRWGTYKASLATPRAQFKGVETKLDPVSGEKINHQPWHITELRVLSSVPVVLAFAVILVAVICGVFTTEVLLTEVYDGPGKALLKFVPIILFVGIVPQVIGAWYKLATRLTDFENHESESGHDRSLSLKMFTLNAISGYGSLTLSAFVYIPFGTYLIPRIVSLIDRKAVTQANKAWKYSIDGSRLVNTLFALNTTTQIIGNVNETITPLLMRKFMPKIQGNSSQEKQKKEDLSPEDVYIQRLQQEAERPQYTTFGDYSEMALQFGHVVLWSTCWPLVPLTSFLNNFFELKGDAFKMCHIERRPIPKRHGSIGPWLDVLSFMTWLAAFTNASLVYMYRPSNALAQTEAADNAAHNASAPATPLAVASRTTDAGPASIASSLYTAFLVGLFAEHIYLVVRAGVRHALGRLLWDESEEALAVARQEYQLKKQAIGKLDAQTRTPVAAADAPSDFWQVDPMDELQRFVKKE